MQRGALLAGLCGLAGVCAQGCGPATSFDATTETGDELGDGDGGISCGSEVWSTPIAAEADAKIVTMSGGDVLVSMTAIVPNQFPNCGQLEAWSDQTARFQRYAGVDGSLLWSNDYKSPDHCADRAIGIAGIDDGRVYAFDSVWLGDHDEFTSGYVLQYDPAGNLLTEFRLDNSSYHLLDAQGGLDRVFAAGYVGLDSLMVEFDLDPGDALWTARGLWAGDLTEIHQLDVFANGEFAVLSHGGIRRVDPSQQQLWSVAADGDGSLDVGGPAEIVGVACEGDIVKVFDAAGNALWQTPGDELAIDPAGDVFVAVGERLEKRDGATGDLLCSKALPLSVLSLAVDEQGAPVVLDAKSISKYGTVRIFSLLAAYSSVL